MATRIKLKRSLTPNSAPTTSDLYDKEVALNIADRTLFVNNNGTIQEVLNADPNDETIVPSMFSSLITDGVGKTWYVSKNGTDKAILGSVNPRHGSTTGSNSWGKTPMTAFSSLKYCLDNYATDGDTVVVGSGVYTETFPLTVPVGVSISGAGFKTTFIKPTVGTNNKDAFLIQSNCNIENITVTDFYYDSVNDTGYAFRTKSGYTISVSGRRPYVQRCSVITKGSVTTGSDPRGYAQGDAGRGVLIDGGVVATNSAEASILFNECTFVVPNSVGLYLKNGARCEWLNSFTYFAADSVIGENPGGTGFAGQGRARLKFNGMSGTFAAGNTITQYDTDGTTVLASGTINQNDGTYIYLTGQGTGNFVEALQSSLTPKQVIVNGDAQISTAIKKFGNSSLILDGTGDYLSVASSSDFNFGAASNPSPPASTTYTYTVTANTGSTNNYQFSGSASGTAPTLNVVAGDILVFNVNVSASHPFWVKTAQITGTGGGVGNGTTTGTITNNGSTTGTITWNTAGVTPGTYYYQCQNHTNMFGVINVAAGTTTTSATGDFALECWVYPTEFTSYRTIFDFRTTTSDTNGIILGQSDTGAIYFYYNSNYRVGPVGSVTLNAWNHVALTRSGSSTRLFINGTQVGSTYTDTNNYPVRPVRIGADPNGAYAYKGYIDEVRISKGVSRYTGTFTPSTTAFTASINTSLLLQFEGLNGSTEIIDGGIASQDIRTSAGGTANFVTLADYTAFGAELRSIGSASIYGERGLTANGKGVRLYCITHNFSYIGTGKNEDNDISQVNQANEVIETNNGRALFTSVDQNGDFRVGTTFIIDQEKGTVSFAGSGSSTTTFDNLIVSSAGNATTILPTSINVGNLTLSSNQIISGTGLVQTSPLSIGNIRIGSVNANTISTSTGNLVLTAQGNSLVQVNDDLQITGNTNFTGDITVGGNIVSNQSISIDSSNISNATIGTLTVNTSTTTGSSKFYDDITTYSGEFAGIITDGLGYPAGTYTNVDLTGGNGSGAKATIVVTGGGISGGSISNAGSGYIPGTYTVQLANVSGTGTGAVATITTSITTQTVSSVVITSFGQGYQVGNVLTGTFGSGSGFTYTVSSVDSAVTSVTITDFGTSKYDINDILSAAESNFGTGPFNNFLKYKITSFLEHVKIQSFETKATFSGNLESKDTTWLASEKQNAFVAIGFPSNLDLGDPLNIYDTEKLEVNGNIRAQGDIKALNNIVASFGSVTEPSIKFDADPHSTLWNRTGFFAEYGEGHGKFSAVGDQGRILRFSADRTDFYKKTNFVTVSFADPTIQKGSAYQLGKYTNQEVLGGSGSGLRFDVTVAFDGILTEQGFGYTDATYVDIPLIYSVLPGGSVLTTSNLNGGSNYINGTYTNVPLTGGTGNFAKATVTIASGSVTNISITNGGSGYTVNDTLSANVSNLGGSQINQLSITSGGSNYANGNYNNVTLTNIGSLGQGATANITVSGGLITSATINQPGAGYVSGDTLSVDTTSFNSTATYTYNVTDTSPSGYVFTGSATGTNPTLTVNKFDDLTFDVSAPGNGLVNNAFYIVSQLGAYSGYDPTYNVAGVTNNGASSGVITWTPNIPGTYYYISANNSAYYGTIQVLETNVGSGATLTVSTLTSGSGFNFKVATIGTSTGGTGAKADIEVVGGKVTSITIVDGGSGYQVFDLLTVDPASMTYVDTITNAAIPSTVPTTSFKFRVETIGVVTVTEINNLGIGYEEGDKIYLPNSFRPVYTNWTANAQVQSGSYVKHQSNFYEVTASGTFGINAPIHTTGTVTNGTASLGFYGQEYFYQFGAATSTDVIKLDPIDGSITSKQLKVSTTSGININDSLSITNNQINKITPGNLVISANALVEISGSKALVVPSGSTAERPPAPGAGAIRFNTNESRFEGFNGNYFVSLGGVRDVDGNTYISAELNPGDDDNIIRFVNDGVQSMQVEQNKIVLQKITSIDATDINGIPEWTSGGTVTAPTGNQPSVFIYYGINVYMVMQSGTLGTTAPTNTTGNNFANGTAELKYVRNIYGQLTFTNPGQNIVFNSDKLILGSSILEFTSDGSAARIAAVSSGGLSFTLTSSYREFIKFGINGEFLVNNLYGQNVASSYIKLFDKDLRQFNLKDSRIASGVSTINTASGNSTSIPLFPYTQSYSGKVMIEISDDSTISRRQYSEISYIVKSNGSDIIYTESNKIYTDVVLCDVEAELDGSNNVAIKVTDLTGSSTIVYNVKVVSQTVLA